MIHWALIVVLFGATFAEAQTRARIGILLPEMGRAQSQALKGLNEELKRLGFQERKNLILETKNAKGDRGALQPAAADLVARKVDVIFTTGTRATQAAASATAVIPIVFVHPGDPVAAGLFKNLAEPVKNVTGVAGFAAQMTEKRAALLREIIPELREVHIFFDTNNNYSRDNFALAESAAKKLGLRVAAHGIKSGDELKSTLGSWRNEPGAAIFHVPDDIVESDAEFFLAKAREKKLPTMFNEESWAIQGATAAYGPSYFDMGRRAAGLIVRIIKDPKTASPPIEPVAKFDLVLNYRTAKYIGLHLSPEILKKADKVIR
jgi:putative ABC transport system substrate-binding protein